MSPLRRPMTAATKIALIGAGYVGAVLVAAAAVALHVAATNGPDRQSAAGMFAFGDSLVFLAAFSAAALPPTAAALFMLRSRPGFWRVVTGAACLIAATALPAPILYYAQSSWGGLAVLRVLVAPVLAAFWFLGALCAPSRPPRRLLVAAAAVEAAVFASVAIRWLQALGGR